MSHKSEIQARRKTRYRHVYISLRAMAHGQWHRIRALDWNEEGFNFYFESRLDGKEVLFKKDLREFSGEVVWSLANDNDTIMGENIVNNLLYKRLKKISDNEETIGRIFRMIRTVGLVNEKIKLLSVAGLALADQDLQLLINKYRSEYPLYRYGIKVQSAEWSEVVRFALEAASPSESSHEIIKEVAGLIKKQDKP